ncbi:MAG: family N-acetyltransferase [Conexibacter sp.]|nr:family N-acetyltransferase [Conexibacter sp.]
MTLRTDAGLAEIRLRPIRPADKDALATGLSRLSSRSVYQRFLSPKPRLSSAELRYLTEVDFLDHYALVAVPARRPDVLVGVGRWVRDAEAPGDAEIAIVIGDPLQGRGVGTRLGVALAAAARERGVQRFTASMLPDNRAAHRLFAKISSELQLTRQRGVDELVADLVAA